MNASRIAPLALYQEVAERLRERIFSHELPPGTWVDEQALAEQYGISRTPLREALKVLASEGLVTLKPRRGCYVTEISERDLDEVFSVMSMLEGEARARARSTPARPTWSACRPSMSIWRRLPRRTTSMASSRPTRPSTTRSRKSPTTAGCCTSSRTCARSSSCRATIRCSRRGGWSSHWRNTVASSTPCSPATPRRPRRACANTSAAVARHWRGSPRHARPDRLRAPQAGTAAVLASLAPSRVTSTWSMR